MGWIEKEKERQLVWARPYWIRQQKPILFRPKDQGSTPTRRLEKLRSLKGYLLLRKTSFHDTFEREYLHLRLSQSQLYTSKERRMTTVYL